MRFDLLDEHSTLVPFGLGVSQNRTLQQPAVPAEASKRGSRPGLLRKLSGALRRMVFSRYRNLVARHSCPLKGRATAAPDAPCQVEAQSPRAG